MSEKTRREISEAISDAWYCGYASGGGNKPAHLLQDIMRRLNTILSDDMDEARAREVLGECIDVEQITSARFVAIEWYFRNGKSLYQRTPTPQQLKAIAWWMANKE